MRSKLIFQLSPLLVLYFVFVYHATADVEEYVANSDQEEESGNGEDGEISVPDIYKMAIPMIRGEKPVEEVGEFLFQFFLDETSKTFIWPKLVQELKENFNTKHSMTDLDRMERHVNDFKDKLHTCINERKGKQKTLCLVGFVDLLLENKNDFWWGSASKGVKFLNFYVSFHLLVLSGMQMCRIQLEFAPVKDINIDEMFKKDAEFFVTQVNNQAWDTCEWRKNEITSVETCKVVDIFREEYVLYCQDRLVRSEISKVTNDFMESFRATVRDEMTGETCFTKRMTVSFTKNKAHVEEMLFNEAIKARDDCVKKAEDKCQNYWEDRAYSIAKEVGNIKLKPGKKKSSKSSKSSGKSSS